MTQECNISYFDRLETVTQSALPDELEPMTARPKTILVADDEEDVLKLVGTNLKNAGFRVIDAKDGATTLDKARSESPALGPRVGLSRVVGENGLRCSRP